MDMGQLQQKTSPCRRLKDDVKDDVKNETSL